MQRRKISHKKQKISISSHFHLWIIAICILAVGVTVTHFVINNFSDQSYASTHLQPNFPRVATIYSKTDINLDAGKKAIAKYNLYVTDFGWWPFLCGGSANCNVTDPANTTVGQYLKQLNPNLITVIYIHSNIYENNSWKDSMVPPGQGFDFSINNVPYYIDLRWFLTYAGSSLTTDITSTTTSIPVSDLSKFAVNDSVIVGGVDIQTQAEMMNVTNKSSNSGSGTLTVTRAQNSQNGKFPAIAHTTGDFVRSVAYAFGDPFYQLMNVTSDSPMSSINPSFGEQNWNQFLASWLQGKLQETELANLDGIFLDNFIEHPVQLFNRYAEADFDNNNSADDIATGDLKYEAGMKDLAVGVRSKFPTQLVIANTGGTPQNNGQSLNGGMIEGIDQNWTNSFIGDVQSFYDNWQSMGSTPSAFLMNGGATGTVSSAQTNYKAVRFELAMTLMKDGYFVYDEYLNNYGHQTTWWYDEYDNAGAGKGYLGQSLGSSSQPTAGVYRRDFTNGIVLANNTVTSQIIPLEKYYKKIQGAQDTITNNGSLINSLTLQPKDGIILLNTTLIPTPTTGLDTTPPVVTITSPLNNAVVARNSTTTIRANASDNVSVTKVEFRVGTSLKCTDTTAPYSCAWGVPGPKNTSYTLSAKAYDARNNNFTSSITVKSSN